MFYLYILKADKFGTYYIGIARDPDKRLKEHNSGRVKSTKHKKPWTKLYQESFATLSMARKRELYLKSLKNRSYIDKLIKHF